MIIMKETLAEEILKEGIETLYSKLGTLKTLKFLQLIGASKGDSVEEIETKTEQMSDKESRILINNAKKNNSSLWKKVGLV